MIIEWSIDNMTDDERTNYCYYGIIPGPQHNNFDVCGKECYVCSFEVRDVTGPPGFRRSFEAVYDLYIVEGEREQSYLLRCDEEYPGSYGSGPISTLFGVKQVPWSQALHILLSFGYFKWEKTK